MPPKEPLEEEIRRRAAALGRARRTTGEARSALDAAVTEYLAGGGTFARVATLIGVSRQVISRKYGPRRSSK